MTAPAEGEALQRLQKAINNLNTYIAHKFGCEIDQTDVCTCGRLEAKKRVNAALNAALAPLAGPVDATIVGQELVPRTTSGISDKGPAERALAGPVDASGEPEMDSVTTFNTWFDALGHRDDDNLLRGVAWLGYLQGRAAAAVPSSPAQEKAICKCGTTMVCPDIGCDLNKPPSSPVADRWQPMETLPKDRWVWVMFGTKNPEIAALRWNTRMAMWQSGTGYWDTPMPFTGWSEMVTQPASAPSPSAGAAQEQK